MRKEVKEKISSNRRFFNKTGALPIVIIVILVVAAGAITYFFLSPPQVMLSGHPLCGPGSPWYCECSDGLDNDGDGLIDAEGNPADEEDCEWDPTNDDECPAEQTLFRIKDLTNAHAAKAIYEFYPLDYWTYTYSVCLYSETTSTKRDCDGSNGVIRLAMDPNEMNAHAEKIGQTNINYQDVCFGNFICDYATDDCSTLGLDYKCYASLKPADPADPDTNLHVGRCDAYPEKLCCYDAPGFTIGPGGRGSSGEWILDVRSSLEGKQVPLGTDFDLTAEQENIQQRLGGDPDTWAWSQSLNGGPFTPLNSGSGIIEPYTVTLGGSPGDTYTFKLEASLDTTTYILTSDRLDVIPLAVCQNAEREYDEECDDENDINGDGCAIDCTIEPSWLCTRIYGELSVCFNTNDGTCDYPNGENHRNSPNDCPTWCSDGQIDDPNSEGWPESCDDGGKCTGDLAVGCSTDADCTSANGICIPQGGDGCDSNCQVEPGWQCSGEPSVCSFCGNGVIEGNEECDDGNNEDGDGCNSVCMNEYCGDRILQPGLGEECDGQDLNGQTCRSLLGDDFTNCPGLACSPSNCTFDTSGCCRISCFPAGTKILMADDSEKNIEDVLVGDYVTSYDEKTGKQMPAKVTELEAPMREHMCEITFEDGSALKLTDEHPIFTKGNSNSWKSIDPAKTKAENSALTVGKLSVQDEVLTKDDVYKTIKEIKCWQENIQTYNLKSIENYNNFFADGVLAHNKLPCPPGDPTCDRRPWVVAREHEEVPLESPPEQNLIDEYVINPVINWFKKLF